MHLGSGKNGREAARARGRLKSLEVTEGCIEDLLVQKDQRVQRLIVGGGRHVAIHGELIQEGADVVFIQLPGMGGVVELDVAVHPSGVCALRVNAVPPLPAGMADLIEEFGRR
jgi:hypothetical protein